MQAAIATAVKDGKRIPKMMRWGIAASLGEDEKLSYSTFNARAEEFATKPAFRDAWKRGQRCVVVTDGFYEWKKLTVKEKRPYAIAMADDGPMVMAGLWVKWKDPKSGDEILSCTILTCGPNDVMAELHNRMPVILADSDWPKWLGEEPATEDELLAMLKPCPDQALKIWFVNKAVGNVMNKRADLVLPI